MPRRKGAIHDLAWSLHGPSGGPNLLLMIWVFADESQDGNKQHVMTMAGLLGLEANWDALSTEWGDALEKAGVDVFHAADCANGGGKFRGWDTDRKESLQRPLIDIITDAKHGLLGYSCSIPIPHYSPLRTRFRRLIAFGKRSRMSGPLDDPWLLVLQGLVIDVCMDPQLRSAATGNHKIGFVFDQHELKSRGNAVYSLFSRSDLCKDLLMRGAAFRDRAEIKPLQAADLFAYEVYRYTHHTLLEGHPERWQHAALRPIMATENFVPAENLEGFVKAGEAIMAKRLKEKGDQ